MRHEVTSSLQAAFPPVPSITLNNLHYFIVNRKGILITSTPACCYPSKITFPWSTTTTCPGWILSAPLPLLGCKLASCSLPAFAYELAATWKGLWFPSLCCGMGRLGNFCSWDLHHDQVGSAGTHPGMDEAKDGWDLGHQDAQALTLPCGAPKPDLLGFGYPSVWL